MTTAAFFDVDGTLYTAHMWRGLMTYANSHERKNRVRLYYSTLMPLYFLRKIKLVDEEGFRKPWVSRMGVILRGWSTQQADDAFEWIAEEYIRPTARDDILARLSQHLGQGHIVVLVSAMLTPVLEKVGAPLNVTGSVGTDVEIDGARLSGEISPRICLGDEKDRLTREFLSRRGIDVDFAASYAYADSISDLALLKMVGHPVAVYPDAPLAAHARDKGWEILPASSQA